MFLSTSFGLTKYGHGTVSYSLSEGVPSRAQYVFILHSIPASRVRLVAFGIARKLSYFAYCDNLVAVTPVGFASKNTWAKHKGRIEKQYINEYAVRGMHPRMVLSSFGLLSVGTTEQLIPPTDGGYVLSTTSSVSFATDVSLLPALVDSAITVAGQTVIVTPMFSSALRYHNRSSQYLDAIEKMAVDIVVAQAK